MMLLLPVGLMARQDPAKLIENVMNRHSQNGFSGVVLVADKGKPVYKKAFGYRDFPSRTPLKASDIFELASVSKPFTAAIIQMLQVKGKLQYDDLVEKYLSIPYKGITIRHLLTHSGGLPDYQEIMDRHWDKNKVAGNQDILEYLNRYAPPKQFEPGTKYEYSNTGYVLLASIAEKVTGKDFIELSREWIFRPLKMKDTDIRTPEQKRATKNFTAGHYYVPERDQFVRADSFPSSDYTIWLGNRKGPGRVSSTADDLLKWDQALYDATFTSTLTLKDAFSPGKLSDGSSSDYGFGWMIRNHPALGHIVMHNGDNPGYRTMIIRMPDKKKTVIVLNNNAYADFDDLVWDLAKAGAYTYDQPHRPQFHFSPLGNWMNDPNGMVYFNNTYHLFFQYYPNGTVWGPMHWGHATSKDMMHWKEEPIALYPDSLGYIFSGSAVVDSNNTSGFGKDGKIPLVVIFTHHDPIGEKQKRIDYQDQSLAYSLDEGKTWIKYAGNPVLKNPGIRDFRDPKVSWHAPTGKWIMTLATLDRITFYSSPDLKTWTKESDMGNNFGAHGGVWECPDLFPLDYKGEQVWVLLVSINPGGPNGGSATQYFTGRFDGKTFTPFDTLTRWIDYGPDNYAGVTWENTGDRKVFMGWMSNWEYAEVVPTKQWRSAMTLPRDLRIEKVNGKYLLASMPSREFETVTYKPQTFIKHHPARDYRFALYPPQGRLVIDADSLRSTLFVLSNDSGQRVVVGYDDSTKRYYIDRSQSGKTDFNKLFATIAYAPRLTDSKRMKVTLIFDVSSVELFADDGLTVMTAVFFPDKPFNLMEVKTEKNFAVKEVRYSSVKSVYGKK